MTAPGDGRPGREPVSGDAAAVWRGDDRPLVELAKRFDANPEKAAELAGSFATAAELRAQTPEEPQYVWDGYAAEGELTLIAGKGKAAGKSTLAWGLTEAVTTDADSFLGRAVQGGHVIYVTEESGGTLLHKLPEDRLRVLTRDATWPKPDWRTLIAAAVLVAKRDGAKLLVVDTFTFWSSLPADRARDAGAMQALLDPLLAAAREGLGVVLIHHHRKGGGEDGEKVRDSTAIVGAVDIVLELEKVSDDEPNQRQVLALSRHPSTPGTLLYDYDKRTGSFGALGEQDERGAARDKLLRGRLLALVRERGRLTQDEFAAALGVDKRKLAAPLIDLVTLGELVKVGGGVKGDPYRYEIPRQGAGEEWGGNARGGGSSDVSRSRAPTPSSTPSARRSPRRSRIRSRPRSLPYRRRGSSGGSRSGCRSTSARRPIARTGSAPTPPTAPGSRSLTRCGTAATGALTSRTRGAIPCLRRSSVPRCARSRRLSRSARTPSMPPTRTLLAAGRGP